MPVCFQGSNRIGCTQIGQAPRNNSTIMREFLALAILLVGQILGFYTVKNTIQKILQNSQMFFFHIFKHIYSIKEFISLFYL